MLTCSKLKSEISSSELVSSKIVCEDIFADTKKQKVIVDIFSKLIEARLKILKGDDLFPSMGSCPRCVDSVFIPR